MRSFTRLLLLASTLVTVVVTGAGANQTPGVHRVMREKLTHSQRLLEAVVTSNWAVVGANATALERLTNDPRWMVFNAPEYLRDSEAFRRAVRALQQAADARDLDASAKAYADVTLRCIDCHRNLTRMRIAR